MGPALVALLSGACLYVACVAAISLHASGAPAIWWLGAALVVACHAGSGFLTLHRGVSRAMAPEGAAATRGAVSLGITGIVSAAALLLVLRFPITLVPDMAKLLLGACVAGGAVLTAVAYVRHVKRHDDEWQNGRH